MFMNYTIHQLRIFLAVAQQGSVTKASELLHLTQPAVSIQLKNFQDQFDLPLTEMIGRRLYVTDFGKEMALMAEKILEQVDAIHWKTKAHQGALTGKLKVSVVSTGKYVMPYFLADFLQLNRGVELQMDVTNKSKVISSLEKNEVDFSLVSIRPEKLKVQHLDLLENKLFLVGNSQTDEKAGKRLREWLESHTLILREKGSGTRQSMEAFLQRQNWTIQRSLELTSNEAVKQAVLAGLGYSIMPIIGIKQELDIGKMKIIPVKGLPIKTMWQLIWLPGKQLSPVAKACLQYVAEHRQRITDSYFGYE